MSLRSGKKDGTPGSPNPLMPKLPSAREMIDDIENIRKNDPILSLAAIIQKKSAQGRNSVVDSDIKELMEALRKRRKSESEQSLGTSTLHSFRMPSFTAHSSLSTDLVEDEDRGTSSPGSTESRHKSKGQKKEKKALLKASSPEEQTLNYDKLKHFLTTCEHSEELISTLEAEFKNFEQEILEHSRALNLELEGESQSADSESESRLT